MTLGSVDGRPQNKLNKYRNVYYVKVCFFRYFIPFKAKQSYQNISRPNTGQKNTAHIPYNLCTGFNKRNTFKIVEYNFIKRTSYLTVTKLSTVIYLTVPTKFSPQNYATYGEMLQRKHIGSNCTIKYGTFLFSKNL